VPRQVETVVNHRVINRRHIVAGVSGGVMVAPGDVLKGERSTAGAAQLASAKHGERLGMNAAEGTWWWDSVED
jgi:hypothetical protein